MHHALFVNVYVLCLQVKQLRTGITNMHGDVVRLNALIAQNEGMSKKLAEANFSLEKEFVVELKVSMFLFVQFGLFSHCTCASCGCRSWKSSHSCLKALSPS